VAARLGRRGVGAAICRCRPLSRRLPLARLAKSAPNRQPCAVEPCGCIARRSSGGCSVLAATSQRSARKLDAPECHRRRAKGSRVGGVTRAGWHRLVQRPASAFSVRQADFARVVLSRQPFPIEADAAIAINVQPRLQVVRHLRFEDDEGEAVGLFGKTPKQQS
jgi:hypothetical protein